VTRNSYERDMFDRASRKLGLERAVLQRLEKRALADEEGSRMPALSKQEVEELLRRGAYGAVMDDEDGQKFCEEGPLAGPPRMLICVDNAWTNRGDQRFSRPCGHRH